jgi:hypothetical protein
MPDVTLADADYSRAVKREPLEHRRGVLHVPAELKRYAGPDQRSSCAYLPHIDTSGVAGDLGGRRRWLRGSRSPVNTRVRRLRDASGPVLRRRRAPEAASGASRPIRDLSLLPTLRLAALSSG